VLRYSPGVGGWTRESGQTSGYERPEGFNKSASARRCDAAPSIKSPVTRRRSRSATSTTPMRTETTLPPSV
jgi:hypothetical protein